MEKNNTDIAMHMAKVAFVVKSHMAVDPFAKLSAAATEGSGISDLGAGGIGALAGAGLLGGMEFFKKKKSTGSVLTSALLGAGLGGAAGWGAKQVFEPSAPAPTTVTKPDGTKGNVTPETVQTVEQLEKARRPDPTQGIATDILGNNTTGETLQKMLSNVHVGGVPVPFGTALISRGINTGLGFLNKSPTRFLDPIGNITDTLRYRSIQQQLLGAGSNPQGLTTLLDNPLLQRAQGGELARRLSEASIGSNTLAQTNSAFKNTNLTPDTLLKELQQQSTYPNIRKNTKYEKLLKHPTVLAAAAGDTNLAKMISDLRNYKANPNTIPGKAGKGAFNPLNLDSNRLSVIEMTNLAKAQFVANLPAMTVDAMKISPYLKTLSVDVQGIVNRLPASSTQTMSNVLPTATLQAEQKYAAGHMRKLSLISGAKAMGNAGVLAGASMLYDHQRNRAAEKVVRDKILELVAIRNEQNKEKPK